MAGRLKLGQILVNRGLLHPDRLAEALADQQATGVRLGATLVRMGFLDEDTLIRTLAGQLKLPVARIQGKRVSPDVLECIGAELAEKHRCLPLFFKQEAGARMLFVAMEDPSDGEALDELARASGQSLRAVLVGPTELEEAIQRHYHAALPGDELPEWDSAPRAADPAAPADDPEALEREPASPPDSEPEPAADPEPSFDFDSDADLALDPGPLAPDPSAEASWPDELDQPDTAPDFAAPGQGAGDELELDDEVGLPEPAWELETPAAASAPTAARAVRPDSLDPRIILRALSQLLVEKGIITREEFVQRLGQIAAREGAD